MIELLELTKRYGELLAVDHVSFTALPGRVTGFLGPNGAGKTTLMDVITGFDARDWAAMPTPTSVGPTLRTLAR